MDQDRKSAVSKLEILKEQNKGLPKDVKSNLTALINTLKDGVPRNMDMERALKALEKALKEKKPDVWKQINEIHNSLATDSTGNVEAESSAAAPEQKTRAHGDTEMGFMEASFRAIIEILETNRDTEPFPEPDEREKGTIGECYKYALKVAGLCKERKSDLDHAYNIIGEIHSQVMEVDIVQALEGSDQPTTIRFKKGSEGTRPTVPKKTEHQMKAESEKKVRTASPLLQKKTDTTSKKGNKEKDQTVPTKTEPNRAQEIEMKRTAVSSALKKLKDTKGALERSSKIIQELYNQVMEDSDDREKTEPLMNTSHKKKTNDTGQTTPQEIEPDIGNELEMKAAAVFAAFKKMKDTKGDLERVSKIIEDLHNRVMEVNVDQSQEHQETQTTRGFKKSSVDMGYTLPKSTVPDMKTKLEKRANDVSSPPTERINTANSYKKETQETKQAVSTEIEPDNVKKLEMKAAAVSEALKKIKDTKGDLEHVSKIIEDLHNQAKEINVDQAQEKQETLTTTGFKQGGVDMGTTVPKGTVPGMTQKQEKSAIDVSSPSKKKIDKTSGPRNGTQETEQTVTTTIEPDIRKELEKKAADVSEALKKIKDTKRDLERMTKIIEDLHNHAKEINVDQGQEKQETMTTTGFKKGSVDMGATVPKRNVPGMTHKQEKSANDVSSPSKKTIDKTSGNRKATQETEQTVPATIEPDIRKELEKKAAEVSDALKKIKDTKREAEYAACLLEELSSFSHATNKDDNGNVLSRPQNVETSQDFKEKDAKNVDNPRQKPHQCVRDENLEKYYKYASHVLRDMKESERLRNDLEIEKRQIRDLKTRLKSIQDENTKLNKEADSLRSRLSEHAGALLYHENPAIADLSDQNRPTKLAERYLELYDNQWTDAFSKLQTEYSSASDEELTGHLYNILVTGKWAYTIEHKLTRLEEALRYGNHMRVNIEGCMTDIMKFKPSTINNRFKGDNEKRKKEHDHTESSKKSNKAKRDPTRERKVSRSFRNGPTPSTTRTTPSQQSSSILERASFRKATSRMSDGGPTPKLEDTHLPNIDESYHKLATKTSDTAGKETFNITERLQAATGQNPAESKENRSQSIKENDSPFFNTVFVTHYPTRTRSTSGDLKRRYEEKERDYMEREKELKSENERLQSVNNYLQQLFHDLHEAFVHNSKKRRKIENLIPKPSEILTKEIIAESCFSNAKAIGRLYIEREREAEYAWLLLDEIAEFVNRGENTEFKSPTLPRANTEKSHGEKLMAKFCLASMIISRIKNLDDFTEKYQKLETNLKHVTEERNEIQAKYKQDMEKEQEKRKKLAIKLRKAEKANEELMEEHQTELQHMALLEKQNEILTAENIIHKEQVHVLNRGFMANNDKEGKTKTTVPRPDLRDPNRPIVLGEQYLHIYQREWKDAFQRLKDDGKDDSSVSSIRTLLFILQDCYRYCREVRKDQMAKLRALLIHPSQDPSIFQKTKTIENVIDMVDADLGDASKHCCDITSKGLAKEFQGLPDMVQKHGKMLSLCIEYVEACIKICWMMHILDPPVCIETRGNKGDRFNTTLYEPYTKPGKKLAYIVWPPLFLTEGGSLLTKGIAEVAK